MHYAQMYAALHADIILQRSIASTLYWAWLVRVLSGLFPACLSVRPGSACCPCCPLNPFSSLESLMVTELVINRTHDKQNSLLRYKFAKIEYYEYGLDHVGGTRRCESNESLMKIQAMPVLSVSP